jgi:hypothetical protein
MLGEHTTDQSDSESGLASARNSHNWPVVNDVMSAGDPKPTSISSAHVPVRAALR